MENVWERVGLWSYRLGVLVKVVVVVAVVCPPTTIANTTITIPTTTTTTLDSDATTTTPTTITTFFPESTTNIGFAEIIDTIIPTTNTITATTTNPTTTNTNPTTTTNLTTTSASTNPTTTAATTTNATIEPLTETTTTTTTTAELTETTPDTNETTTNTPTTTPTTETTTIEEKQNLSWNLSVKNSSEDQFTIFWEDPHRNKSSTYDVHVQCIQQPSTCKCCECSCTNITMKTSEQNMMLRLEPSNRYEIRIKRNGGIDRESEVLHFNTSGIVPNEAQVNVTLNQFSLHFTWRYGCPSTGPVQYVFKMKEVNETKERCEGGEEVLGSRNIDDGVDDEDDCLLDSDVLDVKHPCLYETREENLSPYTLYKYTLLSKLPGCKVSTSAYDHTCSTCKSKIVRTLPAAPSPPREFEVSLPSFGNSSDDSRMALVRWQPPESLNGVLKIFRVTYGREGAEEISEDIEHKKNCQGKKQIYERRMGPLKPESEYYFSIVAENQQSNETKLNLDLTSEESRIKNKTGYGIPFFKGRSLLLDQREEGSTYSQDVWIRFSSFRHDNGKIRKFDIQVRKKEDKYYKTVYTSFKIREYSQKFVIGKGDTEQNPYLESGTQYLCRVVIYTGEEGHFKNATAVEFFKTDPSYAGVISACVGVILLLVVIVAALLSYRYLTPYVGFSQRTKSIELPLVVSNPPDVSVERRILLSDLLSTISRLQSHGQIPLKREYAELRSVSSQVKSITVANFEENEAKNRYKNILPYDETRVILKERRGDPFSDYINASYIHGYSKPREFIACQGPTEQTTEDFWRMIWEKNVYVIVMLTQCVEKNQNKCSRYWPDIAYDKGLKLGKMGMTATTLTEDLHTSGDFMIRKIQITKGLQSRTILKYSYITWPDMNCPRNPDSLINFVKNVKENVPKASRHIVVHCSAGVGRTGTFIALSNLMEEMDDGESLDVFHCVYRMRQHRMNMVQTEVQYLFLYQCVEKYYKDSRGVGGESGSNDPPNIPDLLSGTPTGHPSGATASSTLAPTIRSFATNCAEDDHSHDEPLSDEEEV